MVEQTESGHSYTATFARWERLLAGAEANQDGLPALRRYISQLQAALADTRAARERQRELRAAAQGATEELQRQITQGCELAARLQAGVRLLYGRRSPKLAEFGMKPLAFRRRRKAGCGVKGCPLEATPTAK